MPLIDKEALNKNDRTWMSKLALRLLLTLCCLVAIGLIAWEVAKTVSLNNAAGDNDDYSPWVGGVNDAWAFVALGLSVVWTVVSVPVLLVRKRPVHPGFNVAFDLLLSLGLAVAVIALSLDSQINNYNDYYNGYSYDGSGDNISGISYDGDDAIHRNPQEPYKYTFNNGTSVTRHPGGVNYLCPDFDSCAQQNVVMSTINKLTTVERVAAGFVAFAALLQIVLFIWACVDCHRYNNSKSYEGRARLMAEEMIREMRVRGELPPLSPTGQAAGGFYGPAPYAPYTQYPGMAQPYPTPQQQYPTQQNPLPQQEQQPRQMPMEFYGHPAFRGEQPMQQAEMEKSASQSRQAPAPSGPQYAPLRVKDDDDEGLRSRPRGSNER